MSESWKNRLQSLLLVCTFAVVLSVCNKAMDSSSDGSSSSGTAFADGSTVTISSMPDLTVASTTTVSSKPTLKTEISSLPSVTITSQTMPTITAYMHCRNTNSYLENNSGKYYFYNCDASNDDSAIQTMTLKDNNNSGTYIFAVSLDDIISRGWRPCGQSTGTFCK